MNLQKVYEYALQREQEGFRFFHYQAVKTSNANAAEVYRNLAQEELKHIKYLRELMDSAEEDAGSAEIQLKKKDWFASRAKEELLEQDLVESMKPEITILRAAYLIEKDLAEFYEMAARNSSGIANLAFKQLAQWEKEHELFFKQLHDRIFHEVTEIEWK